jgi:hypothetical protein
MKIRLYFGLLAIAAFLVATTGSDIFARMTIGGQLFGPAASDHFYWAARQLIGTVLLFLPFGFLAAVGAWVTEKASKVKGLLIFALPALYLIYSYFEGYQASKLAELDHRWTAAIMSVGFQPFAAIPVVGVAWLIGFFLVRPNQKNLD